MKKRKILIYALAALLIVCSVVFLPNHKGADLGDFSGDSDFGGSDWGGSSDWGSSSSYSSGSYSSGSGGSGFSTLIFSIIMILIACSWVKPSPSGSSSGAAQQNAGAQRTSAAGLRPMSEYAQLDPHFNEQALRAKLSNLYVQMQHCCTDKDIEPIRPYFTDAMWQQFNRQIDALKRNNRTNYVERIAVLDVTLRGFTQYSDNDHIIAEIKTRIVDYTTDDRTGNLISGSKTLEKFMTYEYDLCRPTGTATGKVSDVQTRHCPRCGAPLSVNETAKCPYCDSVITFKEHDWVVCSIKGIRQQSR